MRAAPLSSAAANQSILQRDYLYNRNLTGIKLAQRASRIGSWLPYDHTSLLQRINAFFESVVDDVVGMEVERGLICLSGLNVNTDVCSA